MTNTLEIKKRSDLTPDTATANQGTDRGGEMLGSSLRKHKAGRSILLDKHGRIIAGNKTFQQAEAVGLSDEVIIVRTTGDKLVAVLREDLDLDDNETGARELAYADNRVSEVDLLWDPEQILLDLKEIDLEQFWTQDELDLLISESDLTSLIKRQDQPPPLGKATELQDQWGTETDQVWQLGEHRLAIGDCTDKATVDAVAFGRSINFIYVDPPYSVSYADKNKSLNAVAFGNRIQTPIENDHLSVEEISQKVWRPAFTRLLEIALPGCPYYCSAPQGGDQMMMMMMLTEAGWLVKHELIWVKNNHVLGRADYHYQHEPIIYGWKPGAAHYFIDSRSEVSTWFIDKPLNSDLHPTEKPVELITRAMRNSSRHGDTVADFFVGSGTTIVAAENLGRQCLAIEIDPGYAAVSIQRWVDMTGQDPALVSEA